eukprot:6122547-Pleurochrysis_carterae.AAC.3
MSPSSKAQRREIVADNRMSSRKCTRPRSFHPHAQPSQATKLTICVKSNERQSRGAKHQIDRELSNTCPKSRGEIGATRKRGVSIVVAQCLRRRFCVSYCGTFLVVRMDDQIRQSIVLIPARVSYSSIARKSSWKFPLPKPPQPGACTTIEDE